MLNTLSRLVRRVDSTQQDVADVVKDLVDGIGPDPMSCVFVFISPMIEVEALSKGLSSAFPDTPVIGCTTAGEIGSNGYAEGTVVAVGLPRKNFCVSTGVVRDLSNLKFRTMAAQILEMRNAVAKEEPDWPHEFATLLVDGLSLKEDSLVSAIMPALGNTQLFGGSAGDGLDFKKTQVMYGGQVMSDAAVLTLVRTNCPVKVFRFDNFVPTDTRMIVTQADPEQRIVEEINAEPAGREYARLVGIDPNQLSPFIFAAHPVVVRVGGQHHVRAIQRVDETGHLRFFSEINEGMVLTVAKGQDIAEHLDEALSGLSTDRAPASIIACDCLLRRLDAEQQQQVGAVSRTLSNHGVVGFSTYGEQFNSMHVNQTFTGVAIYPPEDG